MKVRDVIKRITDDGWVQEAAKSGTSHRQFSHPTKIGKVTVAGQMGEDLAKGTLNRIWHQAGLK